MAEAVTVFTIKAWIVVAVHAVMAEAVAVFAIKARIVVAVHAVMTEVIAVFAIEVAVVFAVHAVRTEVFASAFAFKAITTFAFTHERYWMLTIAFEAFMAFVVMHTRRQQCHLARRHCLTTDAVIFCCRVLGILFVTRLRIFRYSYRSSRFHRRYAHAVVVLWTVAAFEFSIAVFKAVVVFNFAVVIFEFARTVVLVATVAILFAELAIAVSSFALLRRASGVVHCVRCGGVRCRCTRYQEDSSIGFYLVTCI